MIGISSNRKKMQCHTVTIGLRWTKKEIGRSTHSAIKKKTKGRSTRSSTGGRTRCSY